MKNQYNFLKSIDTSASTSSQCSPACSGEKQRAGRANNRLQVKSSLSKLHNLVASRFTSSNTNLNQQQQQQQPAADHPQQRNEKNLSASKQQDRKDNKKSPTARQQQLKVTSTDMAAASPSVDRQQQHKQSGEKTTPDLAKCYEEIDQIYDYIRGLAPLPLQLRKIKSIDFEQLERDKRIQQQQLAAAEREPTASGVRARPTKVRQREASLDNDKQLKDPNQVGSGTNNKQRVQGPLPIKVVTCSGQSGPNVKRVESLNLGQHRTQPSDTLPPRSRQLTCLIGNTSQQQFRLPRAHSTSTLNKQQLVASSSAKQQSQSSQQPQRLFPINNLSGQPLTATTNTHTLPAVRLSRVSIVEREPIDNRQPVLSAENSFERSQNKKAARPTTLATNKPLDLVEGRFVDDDGANSVSSSISSSSESSLSTSNGCKSSSGSASSATQNTDVLSASSSSSGSSETTNTNDSDSAAAPDVQSTSASSSNRSPLKKLVVAGANGRSMDSSKQQQQQQQQHQLVKASYKGRSSSSSKSDRWKGEKSHSDYENDTVSLSDTSGDSSLSDLLSPASKQQISTARGNHTTSPDRVSLRAAEQRARRAGKVSPSAKSKQFEEHIYEQIPAHRSQQQQQQQLAQSAAQTSRPQSLPHNHLLDKSYKQFRQQQQQQQQQLVHHQPTPLPRPFNYPIAYAPNVASTPKQQVVAFLAAFPPNQQPPHLTMQQQHQYQQRQLHYQKQGGTYPMPLNSSRSIHQQHRHQPADGSFSASQNRPLDFRHRLSVGNLHLLPFLNAQKVPLMGGYHQQPSIEQQHLSRSSSSSKVNRLRAPRLSPAQLIAQIQVPRAVSKRQHEQLQQAMPTAQSATIRQQPVYVWQPKSNPISTYGDQQALQVIRKSDYRELSPRANSVSQSAGSSQQSGKRRGARRLTAIGIEEALESIRRPVSGKSYVEQTDNQVDALNRNQTKARYFEPPQLLEAPLIDDDEDHDQRNYHQSDGNEPVTRQPGKKMLAHQQAAAFIQSLNSMSDLHSFSSSASDDEYELNQRSSQPPGDQKTNLTTTTAKANKDNTNFVSSRSFIKCYYGKENLHRQPVDEPQAPKQTPPVEKRILVEQKKQPEVDKSNKKSGGERLLGLIGLNMSGQSTNGKTPARPSISEQSKSSPLKAHTTTKVRQSQPSTTNKPTSSIVGEFLNAEGPILVRDRRIAALRSELVRHYEHPTVQVSTVPGFSQPTAASKSTRSPATKEQQKSRNLFMQSDQVGSTNTTNSTSSYEAAIKNSREGSGLVTSSQLSESGQQQRQTRAATSNGKKLSTSNKSNQQNSSAISQSLIKVPKLSKQSHLLNRPLPKPPVSSVSNSQQQQQQQQASSSSSRRAAALALVTASNQRKLASSGPTSGVSKQQVGQVGRRKMLMLSEQANGSPAANRHQRHSSSITNSASSSSFKSASEQNTTASNSLQPLAVSVMSTQPSPTVTTCTSSGISSRLTSGTHLSGSSSQAARGKTLSELHKQSKLTSASNTTMPPVESRAADDSNKSSPSTHQDRARQLARLALMDDSDELERSATTSPTDPPSHKNEFIGRDSQQLSLHTSNLKLFDEKFSFKGLEQQLASSNDSLLESIDFSGTLNKRQQPAVTLATTGRQ